MRACWCACVRKDGRAGGRAGRRACVRAGVLVCVRTCVRAGVCMCICVCGVVYGNVVSCITARFICLDLRDECLVSHLFVCGGGNIFVRAVYLFIFV